MAAATTLPRRRPARLGKVVAAAVVFEARLTRPRGSGGGAADLGGDGGEGVVGDAAQRGDGADASHDDQRQHQRILHRRRPLLGLEEVDDGAREARQQGPLPPSSSGKKVREVHLARGSQLLLGLAGRRRGTGRGWAARGAKLYPQE